MENFTVKRTILRFMPRWRLSQKGTVFNMRSNKSKLYKKMAALITGFLVSIVSCMSVYAAESMEGLHIHTDECCSVSIEESAEEIEALNNDEACGACWNGTMRPTIISDTGWISIGTISCIHFPNAWGNPQDAVWTQRITRRFTCTNCGLTTGPFTETLTKYVCGA